jgi:CUG-BP- and ETR3-like factor
VQAVVKFNLQRVLSDPTGEQDRPLVVRRANMRKPAAALMMMGGQSGLHSGSGFQGAAGMQAAGMSSNSAMSSGNNLATGMSGMSGSGTLELQQTGSLQQLGLGAPQGPFLLQPMMTMQVRVIT